MVACLEVCLWLVFVACVGGLCLWRASHASHASHMLLINGAGSCAVLCVVLRCVVLCVVLRCVAAVCAQTPRLLALGLCSGLGLCTKRQKSMQAVFMRVAA